jgi:hypothetical protein
MNKYYLSWNQCSSRQVVKHDTSQIKTLAANVADRLAAKKKENPYLAHKQPSSALNSGSAIIASGLAGKVPGGLISLRIRSEVWL